MSSTTEPARQSDGRIPLTGKIAAAAYSAWLTEEVKQAATRGYDLGKTLLTASLTTVAAEIALSKQLSGARLVVIAIAAVPAICSALMALRLMLPDLKPIDPMADLWQQHRTRAHRLAPSVRHWISMWVLSVACFYLGNAFVD